MSLLGNLLGKAIQKGLDSIASKAGVPLNNPDVNSTPQRSQAPAPKSPYQQQSSPYQAASQMRDPRAYFRGILQSEFPQFTVRENVPVTSLVGDACDQFKLYSTRPYQAYKAEWGEPYTFVLYQAGQPKAVVMLGDGHSHCAKVKFLIARKYAQKVGLPYINFYTQMPNEKSYVVGRIRKFL